MNLNFLDMELGNMHPILANAEYLKPSVPLETFNFFISTNSKLQKYPEKKWFVVHKLLTLKCKDLSWIP